MDLPKNITQIGVADANCKIYVEDYVVSFLKQLNPIARDKTMAAALYGKRKIEEDKTYLFVYGAGKLDFIQKETRHLSQAQRQEIERIRRQYFADYEFLGYRILNGEMVEGFDICEQDICRYVSGYAQFYENNEAMLTYMLESRQGDATPESVDSEKYDMVRDRQEKRREKYTHHKKEQEKEEISEKIQLKAKKRGIQAAAAALLVLFIMLGLTMNTSLMERGSSQWKRLKGEFLEKKLPDEVSGQAKGANGQAGGASGKGAIANGQAEGTNGQAGKASGQAGGSNGDTKVVAGKAGEISGNADKGEKTEKEILKADDKLTEAVQAENKKEILPVSGKVVEGDKAISGNNDTKEDENQNNQEGTETKHENDKVNQEMNQIVQESSAGTENDKKEQANAKEEQGGNQGNGQADGQNGNQGNDQADGQNGSKANDHTNGQNENQENGQQNSQTGNQGDDQTDKEGSKVIQGNKKDKAVYTVCKGDTLNAICYRIYGDINYVEKVCQLNKIVNPDEIQIGQKILLP